MSTDIKTNRAYFYRQIERMGISLRSLGRQMGLSHSQLSLTFRGKRRMQLDEAATLARLFGVSLAEVAQHAGIMTNGMIGRTAPIIAVMRGDGTVTPYDGGGVVPPPGLPEDVVAIQARTADSPLAWMDGWLMYARPPHGIETGAVGRFCWVLSEGVQHVGTLRHGYQSDTYSLSPPGHLDSRPIDWATPILLTQHVSG